MYNEHDTFVQELFRIIVKTLLTFKEKDFDIFEQTRPYLTTINPVEQDDQRDTISCII